MCVCVCVCVYALVFCLFFLHAAQQFCGLCVSVSASGLTTITAINTNTKQGDELKLQHCKGVHVINAKGQEQEWAKRACENHDTDVGVCCTQERRRSIGEGSED